MHALTELPQGLSDLPAPSNICARRQISDSLSPSVSVSAAKCMTLCGSVALHHMHVRSQANHFGFDDADKGVFGNALEGKVVWDCCSAMSG